MHRCAVRHDRRYGHAYVPGIELRVPHERGAYFLRTNAAGFRSDHEFGLRNGKPRIVVFGDSFAAGDGVSNAERFTDLLAVQLGADVQNMALSGSGPDQQLLVLEDHPPVDADLVLWCVAVHTIDRILASHRLTIDRYGRLVRIPRPRFVLDGDELVLEGTPVPEQGEPVAGAAAVLPPPLENPLLRAARSTLGPAIARCRRLVIGAADRLGGLDRGGEYADVDGPGWALMSAIARRFHRSCGGVRLVIVPLPTAPYLSGGTRPTYQVRFDSLADPDHGLHVLNVGRELFSASLARRESFTYARDRHYSVAGHAAIANSVARQLVGAGHLRPPRQQSSGACIPHPTPGPAVATLVVSWTAQGSFARLELDGCVVAAGSEVELAGELGHVGAVPLAAINHCMEGGGLVGPELASIVLESPGTLDGALEEDSRVPGRLAPWVRWIGAAERDVRALLHFDGRVEHVAGGLVAWEPTAPMIGESGAEERWLAKQLARSRRRGKVSSTDLLGIAKRWERRTRRARDAARP